MSRITEVEQILDSVSIHDVRAVWRESAGIMGQIQKQLPMGPQEWPFLSKEYAPEAYIAVLMLNSSKSFEDMFRAMDDRLCFYLKECILIAQGKVLRYGETLSHEDIVEWALRDKLGQPPLENYRQVLSFVWVRAALRALDRCLDFLRTARGESAAPVEKAEEPAAGDGAATDRINEPVNGDGAADRPEPLPDVLQAVKLHKKGKNWPESITGKDGEIQGRLFKVTGSIDRAIGLFCELYRCPEWAKALDSAIKRGPKKKKSSV